MKKNNKGVIIMLFIIILMLIVLCILFANNIITFKQESTKVDEIKQSPNTSLKEENNTAPKDNSNANKEDNQKNTNWIDYLENCHILEIKLSRMRSIDLGDEENIDKTITISLQDLKEILSNIDNTNLIKKYSIGMGGPVRDSLILSYEYNENAYKFEIRNGNIFLDNANDELKQLFEINNYPEDNVENKNQEGSFFYFRIDNYSDAFFDKYF